eukprot:1575238-Prymnesium_polylepis.1
MCANRELLPQLAAVGARDAAALAALPGDRGRRRHRGVRDAHALALRDRVFLLALHAGAQGRGPPHEELRRRHAHR